MRWMKKGSRFDLLSRGLRRTRGTMNETERAYANELTADPLVFSWWFQPMSLKLSHPEKGKAAFFTPDFMILMQDGTTYVDDTKAPKKGIDNEASLVRIRAAAEQFALWKFRIVRQLSAKQGGGWERTEV